MKERNTKQNVLAGAALVALWATGAASAGAVTIDFSGYTSGDPIGNTYASDGVNFSGAIFQQCGGGCPPPNPLTGWFAFGGNGGTFTADFSTAQSDITFQTVSFSSTLAQAYNASNVLVASVSDDENASPPSGQLDQLLGSGITHVVFSFNGGFNGPAITNLTFASSVPEPTTSAMMLLGFGVLVMAMRSRRRQTGSVAPA